MSPVPAAESASVFRGTIEFFNKLGVYDVVLPFLLVFTIVFAILEKTKVFGTEKVEGHDITRKNLNGMTAFVTAFFVVASSKLVSVINQVLGNVVLLLLLSICFLMLVGSFHTGKEEFALKGAWKNAFMWIMFIGIVLIFLYALGWLQFIYTYLFFQFNTVVVSSIVLVVIIVVFIFYVTKDNAKKKPSGEKEE
jgi:small-conductance mechanosensitive channel